MRTFPVEEDLVELVWAMAKPAPFEQLSFSDALRRVLRSEAPPPSTTKSGASREPRIAADSGRVLASREKPQIDANELLAEISAMSVARGLKKGRAPKADLRELVRLGYLKEGQELTFVDFRGDGHPQGKAKIAGDDLLFSDGQRYSMSALAGALLKQQGYVGDSVRGPEHWRTSDGKKVRELWEEALSRRAAR